MVEINYTYLEKLMSNGDHAATKRPVSFLQRVAKLQC